jgi:hypothetical protein
MPRRSTEKRSKSSCATGARGRAPRISSQQKPNAPPRGGMRRSGWGQWGWVRYLNSLRSVARESFQYHILPPLSLAARPRPVAHPTPARRTTGEGGRPWRVEDALRRQVAAPGGMRAGRGPGRAGKARRGEDERDEQGKNLHGETPSGVGVGGGGAGLAPLSFNIPAGRGAPRIVASSSSSSAVMSRLIRLSIVPTSVQNAAARSA